MVVMFGGSRVLGVLSSSIVSIAALKASIWILGFVLSRVGFEVMFVFEGWAVVLAVLCSC